MSLKLRVAIEEKRINKYISVDEYQAIQKGDIEAIKNVIARFALDENGEYYPVTEKETEFGTDYFASEKPIKIIGKMNFEDLMSLKDSFFGGVKENAVPPTNASDSDGQSTQD